MQPSNFNTFQWRFVGPYRGGRVMAVAGHPSQPLTYYFGSTGGGVFKTDNAGNTWHNLTDTYFKRATVGAVTIAPSDPNIVYVGMGETGMTPYNTHGDGVYKSLDAGKTWQHLGLSDTQNIGCIEVHPHNPDIVFVAAFGHRFGDNPERGVYRSIDGGQSWELVCYVADNAGAVDLTIDQSNPCHIYASFWQAVRTPWDYTSGGENSRIFRSQDGGDSWTDLTQNTGLPQQPLGKIGLAASSAKSGRVWALIEAEEGGVYRTDDGGDSWTWMNNDRNFLVRPRFFMHIVADPQDADTVYLPVRKLWKSVDGGRTFGQLNVPYVDQHALWVNPSDPNYMILGSDGGASVSLDGGLSWSTLLNQPTAEIYRVAVDTHFPYRIYGAQQDNSTLAINSRSERGPISRMNWYDVGGGESGFIAVRPDNPNIVYSSDLPGLGVTRYDHETLQIREIAPWAESVTEDLQDAEYRFNWSTPVVLSPHDPNVLYVCGNHVFRTTNEGDSWDVISPDLTRNDKSKMSPSGGPISWTHTATDHYCTIAFFAESPVEKGVLWAGTDDGWVQVSHDDGKSWSNVTPRDLPDWSEVNVEPSQHHGSTAYISATAHKLDDFSPYLFMTTDYGQSWHRIDNDLPEDEFIRVVREDKVHSGLLYVGTEAGVYVSLNSGDNWQTLQNNLPTVPVHDMVLKGSDIIIGTFGRGMWILDDISPLQQSAQVKENETAYLFEPTSVNRLTRQIIRRDSLLELYEPFATKNPPSGITVYYWLRDDTEELRLALHDNNGNLIRQYSSRALSQDVKRQPLGPMEYVLRGGATLSRAPLNQEQLGLRWGNISFKDEPLTTVIPSHRGLHRVVFPMTHAGAYKIPDTLTMGITAPILVPGEYKVCLSIANEEWTQTVVVHTDPRVSTTLEEYQQQFDLMIQIRDTVSMIHHSVEEIRSINKQLSTAITLLPKHTESNQLQNEAQLLKVELNDIENELIQPNLTVHSGEMDGMHFPSKLDHGLEELGYQVIRSDDAPTAQMHQLYRQLRERVDHQLDQYNTIKNTTLHQFNEAFARLSISIISHLDDTADSEPS